MRKAVVILLVGLLLLSAMAFSGCVQTSTSRSDGFVSTEKSTTTCGIGGCKTEKKTCPFWDRDC